MKLKDEQAHRVKIGELEQKLAEQIGASSKLEQEVISLRAQTQVLTQESSSTGSVSALLRRLAAHQRTETGLYEGLAGLITPGEPRLGALEALLRRRSDDAPK